MTTLVSFPRRPLRGAGKAALGVCWLALLLGCPLYSDDCVGHCASGYRCDFATGACLPIDRWSPICMPSDPCGPSETCAADFTCQPDACTDQDCMTGPDASAPDAAISDGTPDASSRDAAAADGGS